jgi:two-component system, cell cycle sensor histidine kinase and response regulator CckA
VSAPGRGTTFRVFFPGSRHPDPTPRPSSTAPPWRVTGTVLVVDDEEIVRNTAARMLQHVGLSVLGVSDGHEAIRLYQQHEHDIVCVLLDLTMPIKDGEETLRELRRQGAAVHPIIASGYRAESVAERFNGLDVLCFVQKPEPLAPVITKLRRACEHDR